MSAISRYASCLKVKKIGKIEDRMKNGKGWNSMNKRNKEITKSEAKELARIMKQAKRELGIVGSLKRKAN